MNTQFETEENCWKQQFFPHASITRAPWVKTEGQFPPEPSRQWHSSETVAENNRNHSSQCMLFRWIRSRHGMEPSPNRHFIYDTCLLHFLKLPVRSRVSEHFYSQSVCICSWIFMHSHRPLCNSQGIVILYSRRMCVCVRVCVCVQCRERTATLPWHLEIILYLIGLYYWCIYKVYYVGGVD